MAVHKRARSAISGRMVTLQEARRRPNTTVVETYKTKPKPKR
jgi:hypothetical protein